MNGTSVEVGSTVKVLRGVGVNVSVGGIAACVCVDAAFALCAIVVLMAFGSRGGTGVTAEGTHASIKARVVNQRNNFFPVNFIEQYPMALI